MTRRTEVTRRVRWEAAHRLPDYHGPCAQLHGHSWSAEITCEGTVAADGMVVDMHHVASWFADELEPLLDHALLNDVIEVPSTENVAAFILDSYIEAGFPVVRVTVRETENQTATVHR